MILRRKKNTAQVIKEQPPLSVAIFDPDANSTADTALYLAKEFNTAGKKAIILEFPCLGLSRLLSRVADPDSIPREKSMDQYLLDLDRGDVKDVERYIASVDGVDCIGGHGKTTSDISVLIKIMNDNTLLQAAAKLANQLYGIYDLVIFSLQGLLLHPMTFGALRSADSVIVQVKDITSLPIAFSMYKKLPTYGVREQVAMYCDHQVPLSEKLLKKKELVTFVKQLTKKKKEQIEDSVAHNFSQHVGIINPAEHIAYQSLVAEEVGLNLRDSEQMKGLLEKTKQYLKTSYAGLFVDSFTSIEKRRLIQHYIADYIREQTNYKFTTSIDVIIDKIQTEITQTGPLQPALDDPNTSSIEINSPDEVISEIDRVIRLDERVKFQDKDHIYAIINKMLAPMGKTLTANDPVIDSQYGGFRINVVLDRSRGGLTTDYPSISIRKFPPDVYSSESCIKYGNISREIDDFFADIYPIGPNVLIGGSVNSGKTAQISRIPLYLDPITRILTVEDSEEMMLKKKTAYSHYSNIKAFIVKEHENVRRRFNIARIIKVTLRQNPNWIIIGEVRDHESAEQALEATNVGSSVALTIHANNAKTTAIRFNQLAGNSSDTANKIGEFIDLIIYQQNIKGVRRVTEIVELMGFDEKNQPILNPIFQFNFKTGIHERVGYLKKLRVKMEKKDVSTDIINRWCKPKEVGNKAV